MDLLASFKVATEIRATPETCFDLARDIDLHIESMGDTAERAIAGVTTGLIGPGEDVTFEARHFGIRQRLRSRVTQFDPPAYFQDTMVEGAFAFFQHDHRFTPQGDRTTMIDEITFRSPLGPLGALVDRLFMTNYLRRLIEDRAQVIKAAAERGTHEAAAQQADEADDRPRG